MTIKKKKIAVLGGGMGSLSAVFELTNHPGWEEHYEITVYQLGWRLGGKLAIGRGQCDRIEEHGIHVFLGFYNNTFRVMRDVYNERKNKNLAPDSFLQDWDESLIPQNSVMLPSFSTELKKWENRTINFPVKPGRPGDSPEGPKHLDHIIEMLEWMLKLQDDLHQFEVEVIVWWEKIWNKIKSWFSFLASKKSPKVGEQLADKTTTRTVDPASKKPDFSHVHKAHAHLKDVKAGQPVNHAWLVELMEKFLEELEKFLNRLGVTSGPLHDKLVWAQLGVINIKGMIADGVFVDGDNKLHFEKINDLDYREWLAKHGASEEVRYCAPVRDIYTLVFAYPKGDTTIKGSIAAGTALRGAMLIALGYSGSVMYKFVSGTADVVMSPMYEVLKARGVKFKFFQKVKKICHGENGQIETIKMERQLRLKECPREPKNDCEANYNPFVNVKKIQSWPNAPLFDQLDIDQHNANPEVPGTYAELYTKTYNQLLDFKYTDRDNKRRINVDLESHWSAWKGTDYELKLGEDFDQIICGIPIAGLHKICDEIIEKNQAWQNMVTSVLTVQTQAVQLWFKPTLKELGMIVTEWGITDPKERPITDTYTNPFNSWIDFSDLIDRESWPASNMPGCIVYYCGNLLEAEAAPAENHYDFPALQLYRVREMAVQWLNNNASYFWPKASNNENPQGLDFSKLIEPGFSKIAQIKEDGGIEKIKKQFYKANIDPSERYTLSVPNSEACRLKTNETGYSNLFLTGDWTDCDLNMGCVEATTISGLLCATAVRKTYDLSSDPIITDI